MHSCPPSAGSLPKTEDIDHHTDRAMTTGHVADLAHLIVKKGVDGMMIQNGLQSAVAAMLNAAVDMMNATATVVKEIMGVTAIETAIGTEIVIAVAQDMMTGIENGIEIEAATETENVIVTEAVIETATVTATVTAMLAETMSAMEAVVDGEGMAASEAVAVEDLVMVVGQTVVCLVVRTYGAVQLLKALYPYLKGQGSILHGMSNLLGTQMYLPWKLKYQVCIPFNWHKLGVLFR
ncbi:hypothetical protein PGTUg99_037670 [Puccinia graminis f. sp. tritici]|uniref:Uncharacterized protein n=1 Tax=Puccinia graminis f. sp. tritici TaxID=56615 RepID=A0A5B0RCF9_PUCGR|nr:hypothetical protein PGTUg99_037670 [Puccinia graminis f. sp. tritici]